MPIDEIRTVCFVGAGTMGCFNSLVSAVSGYEAVIHDVSKENLARVPERQREIAAFLVSSGYCTADDIADASSRVSLEADLPKATANADLVSESVPERLELKREIHRDLDRVCPPRTILTTNTSALLVSAIEDAVARGDRFAALHSHLGAPLYDIVGGPRTSPATLETLRRYVRSLRGMPLVLKKEHKGYVFNAMIGPVLTTAMVLVIEGVFTVEEVDRAWMREHRAPMGPFGMMDLFGLDVVLDSWQQRQGDPDGGALKAKIIEFLAARVQRGQLGMKSGRGYYSYPNPVYARPDFSSADGDLAAAQRALASALIQHAVLLAALEVAEPQDIDRAWMVATRLDVGPFGLLDRIGADTFVALGAGRPNLLCSADEQKVRVYLADRVGRGELGEKSGKGFYDYPNPRFRQADFIAGG